MELSSFNLFVGSETGLLKGVNLDKKTWCNINSIDHASRQLEIKVMCWAEETEHQVCIALKNQSVCVLKSEDAEVVENHDFSTGKDEIIVGLTKYNRKFVTCTKSGLVKIWGDTDSEETEIKVGSDIDKMKQNTKEPHLIATGGDENDLKIWDLQKPTEPVFKAKNVANDWLNLRVPVHIKNMVFIPESSKIVTCTAHHQVRVYDPSSPMRRPVVDMSWGEYPITALSLRPNNYQVLVGNTHGEMALLDIRKKGYQVMKYKGFAGAIRDIQCHPTLDLAAACGLDRFLRIYDINSREITHKYYLKSRLNCLLFSSRLLGEGTSQSGDESGVESQSEHSNSEEEDIWNSIPPIETKSVAQKRKQTNAKTPVVETNIKKDTTTDDGVTETKKSKKPKKKKEKSTDCDSA